MSNYLQNLIARTRSPSARVEPRLRTMFEPVAPATTKPASLLLGEGPDLAGTNSPPSVRDTPQLSTPVSPPISPVAPVSPTMRPAPFPEVRGAQAPMERTADVPCDNLLPLRVPKAESSPHSVEPAKSAKPNHAPRASTEPAKAGEPVDGIVTRTPAPATADPRAALVPSRISASPRPLKAADTPTSHRGQRSARKEDATPPAIHVTIGRVDVRAHFPSAAPAAPRPERPTPKVTLEKYLEARNGGAR